MFLPSCIWTECLINQPQIKYQKEKLHLWAVHASFYNVNFQILLFYHFEFSYIIFSYSKKWTRWLLLSQTQAIIKTLSKYLVSTLSSGPTAFSSLLPLIPWGQGLGASVLTVVFPQSMTSQILPPRPTEQKVHAVAQIQVGISIEDEIQGYIFQRTQNSWSN